MMKLLSILGAVLLFVAFGLFQRRSGGKSCDTCHPEDQPKGCAGCGSNPLESNHEVKR